MWQNFEKWYFWNFIPGMLSHFARDFQNCFYFFCTLKIEGVMLILSSVFEPQKCRWNDHFLWPTTSVLIRKTTSISYVDISLIRVLNSIVNLWTPRKFFGHQQFFSNFAGEFFVTNRKYTIGFYFDTISFRYRKWPVFITYCLKFLKKCSKCARIKKCSVNKMFYIKIAFHWYHFYFCRLNTLLDMRVLNFIV